METKLFCDLNIVIDLLDTHRTRHKLAKEAISLAIKQGFTLQISSDMLTNLSYILGKKLDCAKLAKVLEFVRNNFEILEFSKNSIDSSIKIYSEFCSKGITADFEDILQIECAKEHKSNYFLTEDRWIVDSKLFDKTCDLAELIRKLYLF